MNRLELVREIVDPILLGLRDLDAKRCGFIHLYGVSQSAAFLAPQRGLDTELAAIAGMLHDLVTYESGDPTDHGPRSAERAGSILHELHAFTPEEIRSIQDAITHHSDKAGNHSPFAELLKDADVLQHFLYNPGLAAYPTHEARREALRHRYSV